MPPRIVSATLRRTASPAWWPDRSLIAFSSSRSSMRRQKPRPDRALRALSRPGGRGQRERGAGPDDECGRADDQREGEEERALVAAGQEHEEGREGERDRCLEDVLCWTEGGRRQQVVDDQDEP